MRECSPPTMCHMLRVTCQVSGVTCHVSQFYLFFGGREQSGGTSWWRVCYQPGLPRLVLIRNNFFLIFFIHEEAKSHSRFRGSVNCGAPSIENKFQVAKFSFVVRKSSSFLSGPKWPRGHSGCLYWPQIVF